MVVSLAENEGGSDYRVSVMMLDPAEEGDSGVAVVSGVRETDERCCLH
mgnify:CR=1 FL=1